MFYFSRFLGDSDCSVITVYHQDFYRVAIMPLAMEYGGEEYNVPLLIECTFRFNRSYSLLGVGIVGNQAEESP
jgi:hypothetical protein